MEGSSLSDVYTCLVCGMKVQLKILTEHVLLHEEYSAFSYNEATRMIEPLDDRHEYVYKHYSNFGKSVGHENIAKNHFTYEMPQQHSTPNPQVTFGLGSENLPVIAQKLIQLQHEASELMAAHTSSDVIQTDTCGSGISNSSPTESFLPSFGLQICMNSDENHSEMQNDCNIKTIQIHKNLISGDVIGRIRVPLIVNGSVEKLCNCSIVFNHYEADYKSGVPPRNMSSLEDIIDDGEPLDDYRDLEEPEDEDIKAKQKVGGKSTKRCGRTGLRMDVYKFKDSVVNNELQRELQKNLNPDLLNNEAVSKYLQTITGETLVVKEKGSDEELFSEISDVVSESAVTKKGKDEKDELTNKIPSYLIEPVKGSVKEVGKEVKSSASEKVDVITGKENEKKITRNAILLTSPGQTTSECVNNEKKHDHADGYDGMCSKVSTTDTENDDEEQELHDLQNVNVKAKVSVVPKDPLKSGGVKENGDMSDNRVETNQSLCKLQVEVKQKESETKSSTEAVEFSTQGKCTTQLKFFCTRCDEKIQVNDLKKHLAGHSVQQVGDVFEREKPHSKPVRIAASVTNHGQHFTTVCLQSKSRRRKKQVKLDGTSHSEDSLNGQEMDEEAEADNTPNNQIPADESVSHLKTVVYKRKLNSDNAERFRPTKHAKKAVNAIKTTIRNNYICENCGKGFLLRHQYCMHQQQCSDKSVPKCFQGCGYLFRSRSELEAHKKFCSRRIEYIKRVEREIADKQQLSDDGTIIKELYFHCPYCREEFQSEEMLETHRLRCTVGSPRCCTLCDFISKDELSLNRHLGKTHDAKPYQCGQCGEQFRHRRDLNIHKSESHSSKDAVSVPVQCQFCKQEFPSQQKCHYHMLVCSSRPIQKCEHCDFQCKGEKTMTTHLVKAHNLKPFKCEHCDRQFRMKGSLKDHVRATHTKETFTCNFCGKSFLKQSLYRSHVSIQHEGFRFACSYCNKKYKDKKTWRMHEMSHKGAYEYSCTLCKQTFNRSGLYKAHMKELHNIEGEEALALNNTAKQLREKLCTNICNICKETFPLETYYHLHMEKVHGHQIK